MLIDKIQQAIKETENYNLSLTASDVKKCTDLAYLEGSADMSQIKTLCENAVSDDVEASAVCVFPDYVEQCRELLNGKETKVAAVINFPTGDEDSKAVRKSIDRAIMNGAQELDIVFPYQTYKETRSQAYKDFEVIWEHIAKRAFTRVIIEVGALEDVDVIYDLSCGLLDLGVEMLKTSTGKHPNGPTAETAASILFAIKNHSSGAAAGLKVSGGLRTIDDVSLYARLYQRIIGRDWRNRSRLRFGSSQLIA